MNLYEIYWDHNPSSALLTQAEGPIDALTKFVGRADSLPKLESFDEENMVWTFEKGESLARRVVRLAYSCRSAPVNLREPAPKVVRSVRVVHLDGSVKDGELVVETSTICLTSGNVTAHRMFPFRLTEAELAVQASRFPETYEVRLLNWEGWQVSRKF